MLRSRARPGHAPATVWAGDAALQRFRRTASRSDVERLKGPPSCPSSAGRHVAAWPCGPQAGKSCARC